MLVSGSRLLDGLGLCRLVWWLWPWKTCAGVWVSEQGDAEAEVQEEATAVESLGPEARKQATDRRAGEGVSSLARLPNLPESQITQCNPLDSSQHTTSRRRYFRHHVSGAFSRYMSPEEVVTRRISASSLWTTSYCGKLMISSRKMRKSAFPRPSSMTIRECTRAVMHQSSVLRLVGACPEICMKPFPVVSVSLQELVVVTSLLVVTVTHLSRNSREI